MGRGGGALLRELRRDAAPRRGPRGNDTARFLTHDTRARQRPLQSRPVSQRDLIRALAGLRLAVGIASWAVPRAAGKAFGIDPDANPQAPYLARLFGVRDIALAWGALGNEGEARRQWLVAGLACDAADLAAGVAGGWGGYLPRATSVLVSGTALSATVLGGLALREG